MTDVSGTGSEPVRVELLGAFRVLSGGRPVAEDAWPSRRAAELVQLLALAERRRLTRDQVIDALWPQLTVDAGAANLRKAAHFARQALGDDAAVVLGGGLVTLFPDRPLATDVAEFDRAADAALRSGDPAACAAAAAAYGGRLLPDALYEEWTQAERTRLHAQFVELLRQSRQWERLVELEPTDEPAHRELMRAALADGNRHAAIRWYGRLRTNLERELGLPPGPAAEALYAECVEGLDKTAAAFVGRQVELARAAVALRDAVKGEVGALVLRGPGGIGKSALCRQVAASARAQGWVVGAVQ
jgi:DNA-binding SARP family transcriptional activator